MFGQSKEVKIKEPTKICPLLKEKCGIKCAWLIVDEDGEDESVCAIYQIAINT